jgi:hypothetical protein
LFTGCRIRGGIVEHMVVPSRAYGKGVKYQLGKGRKRVMKAASPLHAAPVNDTIRIPDMLVP